MLKKSIHDYVSFELRCKGNTFFLIMQIILQYICVFSLFCIFWMGIVALWNEQATFFVHL